MEVATTVAELRELRAILARRRWAALQRQPIVGLVPTMGALHTGHASLLSTMVTECDLRICSIFVNPRQFEDGTDFERYPRSLNDDVELCANAGVDIVFAPNATEMYPPGCETTVAAGRLATRWEGEYRLGHFDGVLTAVLKLLNVTTCDVAYFGEKDFQQLRLIERMTFDFDLETHILLVTTVRDADGLALSSRNHWLTPEQRKYAPQIHRALKAAANSFYDGERDVQVLLSLAGNELQGWSMQGFGVDYLVVVDPETLAPRDMAQDGDRLLFAGKLGDVRLIDNILLEENAAGQPVAGL
ncbi:MAG: pantoate--beta-alanine ligase [bacterium]|nr:pantoate--beta-alanine ligase [bacterium]